MPQGGGGLQPYDPANPPSDVANTTTDQGKTVPFIVRQERGALDRDEFRIAVLYQPGKPWAAVGAAAGLQQQARHVPRLQLRHLLRTGRRAGRPERGGARARLRDDVPRAQPRRPQLQHRHPGRVDDHGQGARGRALRADPVHDRQRLLGRLAHPAAGGQRLPRRLPGHHARLQLHRRLVLGHAPTWTTQLLRRYFENPGAWAPGSHGGRARSPPSRAIPNPLNAVTFTTAIPYERRSQPQLPGHPPRGSTTPRTNPKGVRCSLHDYMVNIFGRPGEKVAQLRAKRRLRQRGDRVRARGLMRGRSPPPSSPTSTTRLGGWDIDYNPTAARVPADRPALQPRLSQRRDQPGRPARQGGDHRPARARPRRLPRRLPHLRHARAADARARHGGQPGALARAGAAAGRLRLRRPVDRGDGPLAGAVEATSAGSRSRARSSRTSPPT